MAPPRNGRRNPDRDGDTDNEALDAPLRLPNGCALPNRIAKSALSEQLATRDHSPSEELFRLYRRWSAGGAGLLITGNVMVDRRARSEPRNIVLDGKQDLEPFKRWALTAVEYGTPLWMQLNHPGRQMTRNMGKIALAPSAVPMSQTKSGYAKPRAMTEDEISDAITAFVRSATLAEEAGFDGVQLHAAHGYLISQFLSPLTNRRTDNWGGSLENRMRFLLEIIRGVQRNTSRDFALGLKLNSTDFQRGGFSTEDCIGVIHALNEEAIDLLELSGGTYERPVMWTAETRNESTNQREAYFLDYAAEVGAAAEMPILLTGGFRSAAGMREALKSGVIDMVGMARPLAVDPSLPKRLISGETDAAVERKLALGIKGLDQIIEAMWYQWQMHRIAKGKAVKPNATRLVAFWMLGRTLLTRPKKARRGLEQGQPKPLLALEDRSK